MSKEILSMYGSVTRFLLHSTLYTLHCRLCKIVKKTKLVVQETHKTENKVWREKEGEINRLDRLYV